MFNLNADPSKYLCLSPCGGGMRIYISCCFFQKFWELAGLGSYPASKTFDAIGGASAGGQMSTLLSLGKSPTYIKDIFRTKGGQIFDASIIPYIGKKKADYLDLIEFITGLRAGRYSNVALKNILQEELVSAKMSDIVDCALMIPAVQYTYTVPKGQLYPKVLNPSKFYSNRIYENLIGSDTSLVDICMATSSAPSFFSPYYIGLDVFLDGGLILNDMSMFLYSLAMKMKPKATKICILTIGTGTGVIGVARNLSEEDQQITMPAGYNLILDALNYAIACNMEATQIMLDNIANSVGIPIYRYHADIVLDPSKNVDLDSSDDASLAYFEQLATEIFERDKDEIQLFLNHALS